MGSQTYGYLVAFAAAIGGLLFGYEIGVISQVLSMPSFGFSMNMLVLTLQTDSAYDKKSCTNLNETWAGCPGANNSAYTGLTTFTFLAGCAGGAIVVSGLLIGGAGKSVSFRRESGS